LSDGRCASAAFSRPGEAYLLVANLDQTTKQVACVLHPDRLPHPLPRLEAATRLTPGDATSQSPNERAGAKLDVRQLVGEGIKIPIPGDEAILIRVR